MDEQGERLQKIISAAGVASRRAAEELIQEGRVTVNGAVIRELGARARPGIDEIRVDGKPIAAPERHTYILLHKPAGYVTTLADERGRRTVLDLLPDSLPRVYPVGRLDMDSEGLLILTDDGALAQAVAHPSGNIEKEYLVLVEGTPDATALHRLRRGVALDGRPTFPARVEVLDRRRPGEKAASWLRFTIHEGRNRQVRRMCEAVGHPVLRLRRIRIGPVRLSDLASGEWRHLTPGEVASLRAAAEAGSRVSSGHDAASTTRAESPPANRPPRHTPGARERR
ncbi:MAG TPA: pseudouridine synthase [Dehalococcoidia bacterium]|nr:pseudouridine synthase [Dehalococcoidia bacterium]